MTILKIKKCRICKKEIKVFGYLKRPVCHKCYSDLLLKREEKNDN